MKLDLHPQDSRLQLTIALVGCLLACAAIFSSGLMPGLKASLIFATLLYGIEGWRGRPRFERIQYDNGQWWITLEGKPRKVNLRGTCIVLPLVVSLGFCDGARRYRCVLYRDALSQTQHRRLRGVALYAPLSTAWPWWSAVTGWYQDRVGRVRR